MRAVLSAAEVKSRFASALRVAEDGGIVEITRYGKPVAALVNVGELEELDRLRAASPRDGLAGLAGLWKDGEEFAAELERVAAARTPPRRLPELDEMD